MFPSSENNYLLLLSVKIINTPHNYSKTNKTVVTQALEKFCFHQKKLKESSRQTKTSSDKASLTGVSPKAMQS